MEWVGDPKQGTPRKQPEYDRNMHTRSFDSWKLPGTLTIPSVLYQDGRKGLIACSGIQHCLLLEPWANEELDLEILPGQCNRPWAAKTLAESQRNTTKKILQGTQLLHPSHVEIRRGDVARQKAPVLTSLFGCSEGWACRRHSARCHVGIGGSR